jgi:arsenate reductase-like glutaredoxin family protein
MFIPYKIYGQNLEGEATMIKIFSTPNCVRCKILKDKLHNNGIEYEEIDLSKNKEITKEFIKQGIMNIPIMQVMMDFQEANNWINKKVGK